MRSPMQTIRDLYADRFSQSIGVLGAISAINSLFFIRTKNALDFFPLLIENPSPLYVLYALVALGVWIAMIAAFHTISVKKITTALLLSFLPTALIVAYGTAVEGKNIHWIFHLSVGLYIIAVGIFFLARRHRAASLTTELDVSRPSVEENTGVRSWLRAQGFLALLTIAITMAPYCSFGVYYLGKQAIVDEPLWFYERIPRFWRNLGEQDWKGTSVSDKPGITVAMVSGIALFRHDPIVEKIAEKNGETEKLERLFFAMRLPLFLLTVFLLPLFYFFTERLLGRTTALIAFAFVGLSPPLLGIARIVNPDSLLWLFVPMSILSYLVFLKTKGMRNALWYLYATGILMGLALLTKYVSNIVFAFLFGMIFLEHILVRRNGALHLLLKESVKDFLSVVFVALATFYVLFPAVWIKPKKILDATLTSQAFEPILAPALICVILLCADLFLFRARVVGSVCSFLSRHAQVLFSATSVVLLGGIFVAIATVWHGMSPYDFQSILASPKSAYAQYGSIALYFSAFYTLVFGIMPFALFGIITALSMILFQKTAASSWRDRAIIVIGLFILAYYIGSVVTHVGATLRYQIVIFPLALILGAIGIALLLTEIKRYFHVKRELLLITTIILVVLSGTVTLFHIKPFYFSYANVLLPEQYILNPKDMGDGSYQIARYLNAKENAEHLTIWSDKRGVCAFFVGRCKSSLDFKDLITNEYAFDYYVVSKGREARTTTLVGLKERHGAQYVLPFDELYRIETPEFLIAPGGHEANYIKVIDARTVTVTP